MADPQIDPSPKTSPLVGRLLVLLVVAALSLFVLRTYRNVCRSDDGPTQLIHFGAHFAADALPRLGRVRHYVNPDPTNLYGYDGQFYAQIAIDPTLRDPAFDNALDNPAYRARRIGLPLFAYFTGLGKPRWILQAYAVANLVFWFVLAGALLILLRPWSPRGALCLAALVSGGVIASMEYALTDLPACALIAVGFAVGPRRSFGAFAAAALTRETSLLAALGALDRRRPWARQTLLLAAAVAPLAGWWAYTLHRFGGLERAPGGGNFAFPLQAMAASFAGNFRGLLSDGPSDYIRQLGPLAWLYADFRVHEMFTVVALTAQAVYLLARPNLASPWWRTGVLYVALAGLLGPAVWESTSAAARVLLPLTLCFYLLLARERGAWFWPFFVVGGISIPYGIHAFWQMAAIPS